MNKKAHIGPALKSDLAAILPPLYANESSPAESVVVRAKLFCPWGRWTWFLTEFDGERLAFGYVQGLDDELGYFDLDELAEIRGPGGLRIERDLHFEPVPLSQVMEGGR